MTLTRERAMSFTSLNSHERASLGAERIREHHADQVDEAGAGDPERDEHHEDLAQADLRARLQQRNELQHV